MTPCGGAGHYCRDVARVRTSLSPPRLFDLGLALALTVVGLAEVLVPFSSRQGDGSGFVACVGVVVRGLALTQRRTRPLAAALVVFATLLVVAWAGGGYVLFYGQAVMIEVAVYAVVRYAPMRQALVGVAAVAVVLLVADLTVPQLQGANEIAFHWSVTALVVAAAFSLRRLAQRAHESQRRAIEAEVAASQRALEAVIEERARIARELHDIVAHAVSTIVVQAGAAEQVVEDDPARARASLETIRATGASALAEMRRLVTVLREEDDAGPLQPQPGLAALPALFEALHSGGLEVDLAVTGDARPLAPGLDLAAYRIVQEGLTNVRRHSTARRAEVRLAYEPEQVRLEVHDEGPQAASTARLATEPGGHGLVGIRERVALYGGSLTAGPDGSGGFRLSAMLAAAP
jgi:signal transduction histidine kinase